MKKKSKLIPLTETEREFFTAFYESNKGFLLYISGKYYPSDQERDDLVQESLMRLLRNTHVLRRLNRGQSAKYIALTVKTVYLDMERRRCGSGSLLPCADALLVLQEREEEEQALNAQVIQKLKEELTMREWTALEGKYILGCSHEELGQMLDISADTMRSLVSRARKRARKILYELEQEGVL